MKKNILIVLALIIATSMILASCATPTPERIVETQIVEVEKEVIKTVEVEKEVITTQIVEVEKEVVDDAAVAKEFLAGKKICAVLPGPVNDGGWNSMAYSGLVNLRDNFGMEMAYRERTKAEEAAALMREYAESGCNIIQAHGSEYSDQINQVALEYPDVQFMQLSRCQGQEPNVVGLCYSTGEGGYFIGRLAAQMTKTGKIAFIVGQKYPNMDWQPHMAQQAVTDMGLDYVVEEHEVGSWDDPAKAKELAKALIEQDFDVIVLLADSGDTGTIEAIKEARDAGKEVWGISWVKDKNYLGRDFILGGWEEKSYKQMEYAAVQYALNGAPVGVGFPLGISDGVVALNPTYGLVSTEIEEDVFNLFKQYVEDPTSIPNLVVRDDL
ncbi:MAG: BMP family ABC transporter substrate-binding protein [Chloroflexi bacterium]|nr:MAG: BMP family ABC transporter substrate-binding protein [Chloroflexota bacterium]